MTDNNLSALDIFKSPASEGEGVWVDVEHPTTGAILMRWRLRRFGGRNNSRIVREERKLKANLTPGERRKVEQGLGDPDIVQRINRQVFVRVSCLGWEVVDPTLAHLGEFTVEKADDLLERADRMYDLLSDKATEEETFAADALADDLGNSQPSSSGNAPLAEGISS